VVPEVDMNDQAPTPNDDGIDPAARAAGHQPALTGCPWHDVNEMLQAAGLRPTRQRMALGWLLFGKGARHLTAEMLYEEATLAKVPVSLATVYNTLNQLTDEPEPNDSTRAKLNVVQSAIDAAGAIQPTLSDNDVIRLSRALADHRVRDTCLDFDELPDVAATERLWTALARATPAPERAEPACLLAFSAYARGDGVLAGIARAPERRRVGPERGAVPARP